MAVFPEDLIKLLFAVIAGGLIGAVREFRHRAAGFRTIILICLGSTIFTILSLKLGGEVSPVRIAAHMVTCVGFLCAGVILEKGRRIVELTAASTIWLTAALGMGIGGGYYSLIVAALAAAMLILWLFPRIEEWIYNVREVRTYEVVLRTRSKVSPEIRGGGFAPEPPNFQGYFSLGCVT
ncbi:MAG: MgtC/SapB family protein [Anaerolineales bacterium]|nr:MgtC/SapB family protein [Chloroflexota bacterium]MBL6983639.1 MgtC/SapB family protein [Anaerolineales bacterium]